MKSFKYILLTILLLASNSLFAETTRNCTAKYKIGYYSWSNTYHVDIVFMSGSELNTATRSFHYDTFKTYAIIEWDNGGTSVIKTDLFNGVGYSTSTNGYDQDGNYWEISWSSSPSYGNSNPRSLTGVLPQRTQDLSDVFKGFNDGIEEVREREKSKMMIDAITPMQIHYENNTKKTIWTAIHYLDVNDKWQTKGWWELAPGEKAYVADTFNRYFYIYAYSSDNSLVSRQLSKVG